MKHGILKKIAALAMAVTVAVTAVPMTAQAAPTYNKEEILYRTATDSDYTYSWIAIDNLTKSQTIAKSSIKSDNEKVAELESLRKTNSTYAYATEYFDSTIKPSSYSSASYYYVIGLKLHQVGKANISFKIKNVKGTQKVKVTVKKYENPVKSMKVTGINGDLKSKTAKSNYASDLKLTKTQKNASVQVTAAKNWKIESVEVNDSANSRYVKTYSYSKPMSSVNLNAGTLAAGQSYYIYVNFVNSTNGASISCNYQIH